MRRGEALKRLVDAGFTVDEIEELGASLRFATIAMHEDEQVTVAGGMSRVKWNALKEFLEEAQRGFDDDPDGQA